MEDAEILVFKKKLKKLEKLKGKGTQLISLYIPFGTDRSNVTTQLTDELSQSSNIKSPTTKKNVQGALRRIINYLKQIDFKLPKKGLVVFSGNVSEADGKIDIMLDALNPLQELKTKLYWCDSSFHLQPLLEMIEPTEIYGLIVIDKREATVALLKGKIYEIINKSTSSVPGKIKAGGQSSHRFEHLRQNAEKEFYRRVSEKINSAFLPIKEKIKGIIVGGPGITKNEFLDEGIIHIEIKNKLLGTIDCSYTDEYGIKELIDKSQELLHDTALIREKQLLNNFFELAAKDGLVTYGEKHVLEAVKLGKAKTVIISEKIDWIVLKLKCLKCNKEIFRVVKNPEETPLKHSCPECKSSTELLEEVDYMDYLLEKINKTGAKQVIISTESSEGEQFFNGFGGFGAFLRYK
ncbi:MAG: peptide chain release factor aRF-1 [archaeon]